MAVLNITTNKTRAQMVTELTNWDRAVKAGDYDYCWIIDDDINVTATIDISGFNLIFKSGDRIYASSGGTINVSNDFIDRYNYPARLMFGQASDTDINLVSGSGRWVGKGLTIAISGGNLRFNSNTSQTNLEDLSVDAIKSSVSALRVLLHANGVINLYRVTGMTVIRYAGILSMNPYGAGLVSSQSYGPAKLVAINSTFAGFVISSDATHRTQTASSAYNATTMTFVDGKVNPEFLDAYPKDNDGVIRLIKRTLTLNPKDSNAANVTAFKYRVLSKRVVMPGGAVTDDYVIVSNASANYGDNYLMTVWRGVRATGSSGYNPLRDQTIDKELTVKVRKYGYNEGEYKSNSYYYAQEVVTVLQTDYFIKDAVPTLESITTASQFYDGVRSLVANNFVIPEDLLTTDGETLTIKTGWELGYSTFSTELLILTNTSRIILGRDSFIGKNFNYSKISGNVSRDITPHTDLIFARQDGKANLDIQITCPTGASNPIVGVWAHSQGLSNRSGMLTATATGVGVQTLRIAVNPATKYYCVAKALGTNQFAPFVIDPVGSLGTKVFASLFVYEKANGNPILPLTLTAEQTLIANMFIFDAGHVDIKIPTTYAANPRWSATDKIWQFTSQDFIPIAWKLDFLQTTIAFLQLNQILYIQDGSILVSGTANTGILEQDSANGTTVGTPTVPPKISITTISIGRIGDTNGRNTFINNKNGTIDVRGGVPVAVSLSGGFTNDAQTKLNETHQRLALDSTKPLTSKPDGGITSTGIAITATELADGSVVQTRGT